MCQKTFKRKDYLKQHMKIHAPERDMCRCPREGCGRTYTTVFNLQSHILAFHEEWRPFVCEHTGCGKTFATRVSPPSGAGSPGAPGPRMVGRLQRGPQAFPSPRPAALDRQHQHQLELGGSTDPRTPLPTTESGLWGWGWRGFNQPSPWCSCGLWYS